MITRILFLLSFLVAQACGQMKPGENLLVTGIPDIPQQLVERTNQYSNVRAASFLDWDPAGGGLYIATRFGNTAQVHAVAAAAATRQQLTFFDEPVSSAAADPRPGKHGFLFLKDVGGSEFYQVFYFNRTTGSWTMLSDGSNRHEGLGWSRSGRFFACSSNKRNKKDTDVWIMDPDTPGAAWALTEREGAWYAGSWSFDDRYLVVSQFVSANDIRPFIADLTTRTLTPLRASASTAIAYGDFEWSRDGGTLYYTSDEGGEFKHLHAMNVKSGVTRDLTPSLQWDVERISVSRTGRYLAATVNEDGVSTLHLFDLPSMKPIALSGIPPGIIGGLSFDMKDERLALTINAAIGPGDVHVLDLKSLKLARWTFSEVGGLDTRTFIAPTLIHFPTFDTVDGKPRKIPAFLTMPRAPKGKVPVIISIHGGPEGQSRPGFSSPIQFWANELGCAVIDPNVRGSTGYGKTYLALDNGMNREHSVRDIGALLDWIASRPELDANRVAVIGGSYGGYMVLASLATYPSRIRCGVDVVGISNFVTFLEKTESYRRDLRRVEYGDEREPAMRSFLESISPLNKAGNIRSPLFVAQGENDPRVPAAEARQIVAAVEKSGVPVWTMFAKDEGHGFAKKNNRDYYMRAVILFFEKHLLQ
ncbi:MAG: S9 family peptidase [Ignavibacteria bacterium]|nr:S9 family peptidase [Ignavibacteria bacterium]